MKKTASLNYSTGKKWRLTGEDMWGYAFIAVAMIVFCVFTVYPVISAFFTSFEKYKPLGSTFVGLENYKTTFSSSLFYKSIWNTLVYTVFTVPLSLCISFIVAILILPFKKKVQSLFKSMY